MTRKISLITAVVATALLVAVPLASGQSMPDAFERSLGTQARTIQTDAFERAAAAGVGSTRGTIGMTDASERVAHQLRSATPSTDAFQRALERGTGLVAMSAYGDQHERIGGSAGTATSLTSSASAVEWPQIGFGFGLGIALALGLGLAVRLVRPRELVS